MPWEVQCLGAGVYGLLSNPQSRAASDCGEMYRGDVREEIVVGNTFGGELDNHGRKAILLGHA